MSIPAKAALLEEYALVARALSSPARLMLLEHLAQAERGVDALAHKTGLSLANVSQHLQQLRRAGLVTSRRDGKSVIYRLSDPEILAVMDMLHRLAGRNLAQVDRILRGLSGGAEPPEPISRADLAARLAEGSVTVLDVRPDDEYAAGHIPGARQVTLDALDALAAQMDPGKQIVAYCRGPYCVYAHQAVAALRARGFDATRMQGGLPEWRAEGRAVETAHP
ncbi:ArsR/SmtB family transcription factor [Lacimonas salitolerans]|uniref:ArsR/SmtB family transcription factor n=1 Tax=Lacimonas salitolerans TaxID=1323750 RepID=A0ABW4EIQ6_9RHOB